MQQSIHEKDVHDLFLKLSVPFSKDNPEMRLMNYDGFLMAINSKMEEAYYYGKQEVASEVDYNLQQILG